MSPENSFIVTTAASGVAKVSTVLVLIHVLLLISHVNPQCDMVS